MGYISSADSVPTILQLKFKLWSDFKFAFSMRNRDIDGSGGVVFRFRDVYNYYFLEFSETTLIVGRFVNG